MTKETEHEAVAGAIAVVGMACRYPGADSVRGYLAALRSGTEGITRFQRDDLVAAGVDPELARRSDYVPARGVLTSSRGFDWPFYGYSRAEAATIDPQHRIFLQCASDALDDAGIDPTRFPGWIGVYAGGEGPTGAPRSDVDPMAQLIGRRPDFLTTRVAYRLGLRGPAVTVQTACSTSLTAVHMAVQSLLGYECDAALAGGVSLAPDGEWGYLYQEGGILSPDGHCRPFDEHSAGTVPGEGVGIVVLKRLEDALRNGDRIAGVILGSALNNDGGDKIGYTAPSIPGQRDVILLAQKIAGVDPADIGYVEAHGTGTRIGDPVELQALTDAFRQSTNVAGACWIGSVKSNIGHTGSASGVAGLIKTLLMLDNGEMMPTLHYGRPNPLLRLEETPFRVCARLQGWPEQSHRLAAVSSFGVGGTNAHVIVGGSPTRSRPSGRSGPQLLAVSGASSTGRARMRDRLAEHLDTEPDLPMAEVARTLAARRHHGWRTAIVAEEPKEAARLLRTAADAPATGGLDQVAFLFPGQGTLTGSAGAAAYRLLPAFSTYFDEWARAVRDQHGIDLSPVVDRVGASADWFGDTVHQQLGLLALGHALGRQLADWGITPAAMLGNSIGEYAAATLAGVWTVPQAARVVHERASAMRDTEPGRMVAVTAPLDDVLARIGTDGGIAIAVAGPARVVISGTRAAVDGLMEKDALKGLETRLLDVGRVFHSPAMEPAAQRLRDALAAEPGRPPELRVVSSATADWADPGALCSPEYWAEQLCRTVRLEDGLSTVLAADCGTFIELGPGTSMIGALRRHRDWDSGKVALPFLGRGDEDGEHSLLRALGTLWERGARIDAQDLGPADGDRPFTCSLPGYPFAADDPGRAGEDVPVTEAVSTRRTPVAVAGTGGETVRPVLQRLWCQALGVASVADDDDFFLLGGESLMAVSLMGRLREHLDAGIPVAEFSREATFGRLVELVEKGRTGAVRTVPGLVTLREGVGRPLFLAADSMGSTVGYQVLASLLDTSRPVYGLEPVGRVALRGALPSIEEVAAQHVNVLRQVQPSGPYRLGGWSFGAVVAHEMARRLTRAGETVDALICLDGYAPYRRGLPIASSPAFLAANVRLQIDAALGRGRIGAQVRRTPELRRRFIANIGALLRYRPRPVPCPAAVVAAGADATAAARLRLALAPLYPHVVVHRVDGDHWSIMTEPYARAVAEKLRPALAESADPIGVN